VVKKLDLSSKGKVMSLTTDQVTVVWLLPGWTTVCRQVYHLGM